MKKITSLLFCLMAVTMFNCSESDDVKKEYPRQNVKFRFIVEDVEKEYIATFQYSDEVERFVDVSGTLREIVATDFNSKKAIYVYTLKQYDLPKNGRVEWEKKVGYYGYDAGCFYWGTLITGDNGEEMFINSSSNYNPPICPGGEWAFVAKPVKRGKSPLSGPSNINRNLLLLF